MPVADCGDYAEIPVFPPSESKLAFGDGLKQKICTGCPWQTVGITQKSPSEDGGDTQKSLFINLKNKVITKK